MFDKELVVFILEQIADAVSKIIYRTKNIKNAEDFTDSLKGWKNSTAFACFSSLSEKAVIL